MQYERRERRGFVRRFPPKPVEIGKEYDVDIEELSRRGDGIARIKGLVTFVPNAKPGDKVRIKITRISRRFAEAEVVEKGAAEEPAEEEATEEAAEEPAEEEAAAEEEPTEEPEEE
jgi:predicted RNA-binding protein with TRAM domain